MLNPMPGKQEEARAEIAVEFSATGTAFPKARRPDRATKDWNNIMKDIQDPGRRKSQV
jgi:hypothetical protein